MRAEIMKAKIWIFAVLAITVLAFAAVADDPAPAGEESAGEKEEAAAGKAEKSETAAPEVVKFEGPILVTSAGQSVDIKLAGVLLTRLGIEYASNPKAISEDLKGIKTLIVVPGYSSKGLGSAGISRDDEMKRIETLLASASKSDIRVLAMHLGGNARRGVQSDDFNAAVVRASDMAIVVAQGDEDGFFSEICKEERIPLKVVKVIADAMKPLEEVIEKHEEAPEKDSAK